MDDIRLVHVPDARSLELRRRRLLRVRAGVLSTLIVAGGLAACTPAFRRWARAHALGAVCIASGLALLAALPYLVPLVRSRLRDTHFGRDAVQQALSWAGGGGTKVRVSPVDGSAALLGTLVLVDPVLVAALTPPQLAAVLAHELGHWPVRYRPWLAVLAALASLPITAAALAWRSPSTPTDVVALAAAFLAAPGLSIWTRSFDDSRHEEHLADLHAARRVGALAIIGALLELAELEAARLDDAIAALERRSAAATSSSERAKLTRAAAFWRTLRTSPTFVEWRRFDANGNGEIEREELQAMLAALAPWPTLHLDVLPRHASSTHPGTLERILFIVREEREEVYGDDTVEQR